MKEISIIYKGVRYDAVYLLHDSECSDCDLRPHCRDIGCIKCYYGQGFVFKKSDKKFEKMKDINELVKVSTYAKEKGVSVQAIYKQISKGKIESVKIDEVTFVKKR